LTFYIDGSCSKEIVNDRSRSCGEFQAEAEARAKANKPAEQPIPQPSPEKKVVRPKQTARKSAGKWYGPDDDTPIPPPNAPKPPKPPAKKQQPATKKRAAASPIPEDIMDIDSPSPKKKSKASTKAVSKPSEAPEHLLIAGRWIIRSHQLEDMGIGRPLSLLVRHASDRDRPGAFEAAFSLGILEGYLRPIPPRDVTASTTSNGMALAGYTRIQWRGRDMQSDRIQLDTGSNTGWIRFATEALFPITKTLKGGDRLGRRAEWWNNL
jgi:hypothetical protein